MTLYPLVKSPQENISHFPWWKTWGAWNSGETNFSAHFLARCAEAAHIHRSQTTKHVWRSFARVASLLIQHGKHILRIFHPSLFLSVCRPLDSICYTMNGKSMRGMAMVFQTTRFSLEPKEIPCRQKRVVEGLKQTSFGITKRYFLASEAV